MQPAVGLVHSRVRARASYAVGDRNVSARIGRTNSVEIVNKAVQRSAMNRGIGWVEGHRDAFVGGPNIARQLSERP